MGKKVLDPMTMQLVDADEMEAKKQASYEAYKKIHQNPEVMAIAEEYRKNPTGLGNQNAGVEELMNSPTSPVFGGMPSVEKRKDIEETFNQGISAKDYEQMQLEARRKALLDKIK